VTVFVSEKKESFLRIEVKFPWRCMRLSVFHSAVDRKRISEQAHSLVENMVASALLGFILMALYGAFSFGFGTIKVSQEDLRAGQVLLQKLETIRVYDWNKITSGYVPTNFTADFSSSGGVIYNGTIEIDPVALTQSYSNTLREVTVSLWWDSAGVTRRRSMTTLVSQNGIQTYKP
jgi:hypothetical protein